MGYSSLISYIQSRVYENDSQAISGTGLQEALLQMVASLGDGYQFKGVATPTTNPGTPDQNVFYIASEVGTYSNFGLSVGENEVAVFLWNGTWHKQNTGAASAEVVSQLGQEINDLNNSLLGCGILTEAKDFVQGAILSDGSFGPSGSFYRSDYIPVKFGNLYYFISTVITSTSLCLAEYDSNHTFISGIPTLASARKEFYTPSTSSVAYIAISSHNNTPCTFIDLTDSILSVKRESPVNKLGLKVISNNLADFANIVTEHSVTNRGAITPLSGWDYIAIDVSQFPVGQNITFGGFYLGRAGFFAFYNALDMSTRGLISYGSFNDPEGTATPKIVTKPTNANWLVFDIKTALSPSNPYSGLMVNLGTTLKQQDTYAAEVEKINDMAIYGTGAADVETLIVDLPVSDGTDIASGYAYIDSTTRTVKVKE